MKRLLVVLLVAFTFNGFAQQKPLEWHTDVTKAINMSVQSGKPLLFFFGLPPGMLGRRDFPGLPADLVLVLFKGTMKLDMYP